MEINVLLVDDDKEFLEISEKFLANINPNLSVTSVTSVRSALGAIKRFQFDVIVVDLVMSSMSGLDLLATLKQKEISSEVIILTGMSKEEAAIQALNLGASHYLTKGGPVEELYFELNGLIVGASLRRRMRAHLRQQREQLTALLNSTIDAVVVVDSEGAVTMWNPAAADMFGYSSKEAMGSPVCELILPDKFKDAHNAALERFKDTGTGNAIGNVVELVGKRKDGSEFPVEMSLAAFKIEGQWAAVGTVREITERKSMEQALRKRVKELECMYSVAEELTQSDTDTHDCLETVVSMIPQGFEYPDTACARITFGTRQFTSPGFEESETSIVARFQIEELQDGIVEVFYLASNSDTLRKVFLTEEENLLHAIAGLLGEYAQRKEMDRLMKEYNELLLEQFEKLHPEGGQP
jgi:PAS domain S-box-containing protein